MDLCISFWLHQTFLFPPAKYIAFFLLKNPCHIFIVSPSCAFTLQNLFSNFQACGWGSWGLGGKESQTSRKSSGLTVETLTIQILAGHLCQTHIHMLFWIPWPPGQRGNWGNDLSCSIFIFWLYSLLSRSSAVSHHYLSTPVSTLFFLISIEQKKTCL